jgi:hypothetical protein
MHSHAVMEIGIISVVCKGKSKAITVQAWKIPRVFHQHEAHLFPYIRHMHMTSLSVLRTGRLYTPASGSSTHFC